MLFRELCVQILDLILYDLRVAEASPVYDTHALLDDVRVRWIAHLKDLFLLDTEDAVVCIEVGYHEVENIRARAFLEAAGQLEQTEAKADRYPLLAQHLVLHLALQFPLVLIDDLIVRLAKQHFPGVLVKLNSNSVLLCLFEALVHVVLVLAQGDMLVVGFAQLLLLFSLFFVALVGLLQ